MSRAISTTCLQPDAPRTSTLFSATRLDLAESTLHSCSAQTTSVRATSALSLARAISGSHAMKDALRHFVAEFVGVFALVFVGSGSIMMARYTNAATPLIIAATAHGLILAVMVTATMRISGHLNPAVTVGFLAARRIEPLMAAIYIVAQVLGAILAAYALKG